MGEPNLGDSSGPSPHIYSEDTEGEDDNMAEQSSYKETREFNDGNNSQPLPPLYPEATEEEDDRMVEQPSYGRSFFSIYSKIAKEEDKDMVERWQKDAEGILVFVSPRVEIHAALCIN